MDTIGLSGFIGEFLEDLGQDSLFENRVFRIQELHPFQYIVRYSKGFTGIVFNLLFVFG